MTVITTTFTITSTTIRIYNLGNDNTDFLLSTINFIFILVSLYIYIYINFFFYIFYNHFL